MAKVIGIDLGTTNSCVAVMDGKSPKIIENREQLIDPVNAYQIVSMLRGAVVRGTGKKISRKTLFDLWE